MSTDLPKEPVTLGDFELRRVIGRGGMGTVYAAWQRSLQRHVAVKVLSRQVGSSKTAVVRFQREAQAAAKLHHAHIVPIFGAGEDHGVYFYAMELVDGPSLNTVIAQTRTQQAADTPTPDLADTLPLQRMKPGDGPSAPKAATLETSSSSPAQSGSDALPHSLSQIESAEERFTAIADHMASVADALDYAHRQGVIHRDIKPHNLILGSDGKMRISDFGLARLSEQPGVTITGELLGSPLYMSPEQIRDGPAKVDRRTDIYSLGVTLYEWLTLKAPYPGETREQVISKILTSEPVSLRNHNSLIPTDLETICLKAIERDRQSRYQTGGVMRDDLRRFLDKQPIKARRAGVTLRIRKLIARHRLPSLATAAAIVALLLGWALMTAKREVKTQTAVAEQANEERERIEDLISLLPFELGAPFRLAEAARPMFEGVVGTGLDNWTGADGSASRAVNVAAVATPTGIARRAVEDFYRTIRSDGLPASVTGGTDAISALLRQASENWQTDPKLAVGLVDACLVDHPDHFEARQLRTMLLGLLGRYDAMRSDAEVLVRLSPNESTAYVWRGVAHLLLGDAQRSLIDLNRAAELNGLTGWISALRGLALAMAEQNVEAIAAFDNALETEPDLVVALLGRAGARTSGGNVPSAVADLTRAIELEPKNADALTLRGDYHVALGDFAAAERDYDHAMAIVGRTSAIVIRYLFAHSRQRSVTPSDTGRSDTF